jgi:glycosyltransferase involved in cell wall biosynthesis
VLPTLHEGSCNVIIEAMACGLPIISSKIPEIEFQCDDSFSILIDPLNIDQLKHSIAILLADEEKIAKMGKAAIEHSKKFDLQQRAIKILNFISK